MIEVFTDTRFERKDYKVTVTVGVRNALNHRSYVTHIEYGDIRRESLHQVETRAHTALSAAFEQWLTQLTNQQPVTPLSPASPEWTEMSHTGSAWSATS